MKLELSSADSRRTLVIFVVVVKHVCSKIIITRQVKSCLQSKTRNVWPSNRWSPANSRHTVYTAQDAADAYCTYTQSTARKTRTNGRKYGTRNIQKAFALSRAFNGFSKLQNKFLLRFRCKVYFLAIELRGPQPLRRFVRKPITEITEKHYDDEFIWTVKYRSFVLRKRTNETRLARSDVGR